MDSVEMIVGSKKKFWEMVTVKNVRDIIDYLMIEGNVFRISVLEITK